MRLLLVAAAASLGALGLAAPASATVTTNITNGTANVIGDGANDKVAVVVASATAIGIDVGADGTIDSGFELFAFSNLAIDMGGGDDTVTLAGLFSTFGALKPMTVNGGDGNDTLIGSNGFETLNGGPGNDTIDARVGPDVASGGPGDDTFLWVPGDGNHRIDGDDGRDTLSFSGSDAAESDTVVPNGSRVSLRRDVANVSMDLGSLEQLSLPLFGGNDSVIAANGLRPLALDAAAGAGDDVLAGGDEDDHFDGGADQDVINAGGGNDAISGGTGNDLLRGDVGDDAINGDAGDDQLFGDAGTDALDGGPGVDQFHCGGPGDTVVFEPADLVAGDCLPFPVPPPPSPTPSPPPATTTPNPVTTTTTVLASGGAPSNPQQAQPPAVVASGLAAGTRGFSSPRIQAAGANLKVSLVNTAAQPIDVSVSASEKIGRRTFALGKASATLAPGEERTLVLHPSNAARNALHGRRTRHPVITVRNVDTGGALTLKARVK